VLRPGSKSKGRFTLSEQIIDHHRPLTPLGAAPGAAEPAFAVEYAGAQDFALAP
jgi:hypothetical protein